MTHDFKGKIGRTFGESTPWWPPAATAPDGAPHVVFIVLDDVGFSDLGCYGSEISTPNMDGLASAGIRYNNFHVTAMCSPTRACLLTGRNAHAVGVGAVAEWANGFPGYEGRITKKAATVAEMFAEHGYGTYAVGKWHLSNLANYAVAGPHPDWPLGRGFSRWYGFLGGYADHWNPDLHEDNRPVRLSRKANYHLSEDLADHAIEHVRDHVTSARGRPFLMYLALGAGHWPLHAPADYMARQKGRYDEGWDVIRKRRFERQKALGIVPAEARLSPRNPGVPPWSEVDDATRTGAVRLQEAYAAFMEHADTQIGRFLEYLDSIGERENTIVVLLSDNGASGEGGDTGAFNIRKHQQTEKETSQYVQDNLEKIGSEFSFPHYPQGWAQVSNTPLKWYKKNTHGGGIRAPLIVSWPKGLGERGAIRSQYHHVIDVLPTLLELTGVQAPATYRGVEQMPVHGVSMAYTFKAPDAPTRRRLQYFEIVGDRALCEDGWKVVAKHRKGDDFDADRWELFDMTNDFSETTDLASVYPERVKRMVDRWWEEAQRFGVLPLDDRESERALDWFRSTAPSSYRYLPGMARADRLMVPAINGRDWLLECKADFKSGQVGGVMLAIGNRFGGVALYCHDGRLRLDYIYSESHTERLETPQPIGEGRVCVRFERAGSGGRLTMNVNGTEVACELEKTWTTYGITAGLTCGYANVPVVPDCATPAVFQGSFDSLYFHLLGERSIDVGGFAALLQEE